MILVKSSISDLFGEHGHFLRGNDWSAQAATGAHAWPRQDRLFYFFDFFGERSWSNPRSLVYSLSMAFFKGKRQGIIGGDWSACAATRLERVCRETDLSVSDLDKFQNF